MTRELRPAVDASLRMLLRRSCRPEMPMAFRGGKSPLRARKSADFLGVNAPAAARNPASDCPGRSLRRCRSENANRRRATAPPAVGRSETRDADRMAKQKNGVALAPFSMA